jgi:hypothetical protein
LSTLIKKELTSSQKSLKIALSVYFFLLIFEGAIRRWILPEFSGPLLLVRDPLAIYILFLSWKLRILKLNGYLMIAIIISVIALYSALLVSHGNLYIALYGLRVTLLHFPLLFVIESLFNKEDIIRIARWMILLCIPMLLLTVVQFYSPQSAWINKAIGDGIEGGGFVGAKGYFRPPGTFSFTNGLVLFFTMCAAFIYWGIGYEVRLPKWIIYLSLSCLLLSIPFSISRTLLFSISITTFFFFTTSFQSGLSFFRITILMCFAFLLFMFFGNSDFLGTGIDVFKDRFEAANDSEGGIQGVLFGRFLGGLGTALNSTTDIPFWGYGIGAGTNVGSQLMSGKINFTISEGEWGRILGELGPFLGLLFISTRIILALKILRGSIMNYKSGNLLSWLMMPNIIFYLIIGQWAQPTSLGFSVFFGGVLLAAIKVFNDEKNLSY